MKEGKVILKDSPIPIYYQIYVDLKNRVLSTWGQSDNQKLPSENELAKEYGVSRVCMRQALAELEKDGLIVRYRSKGTFVKKVPKPLLHNLELPNSYSPKQVSKYIDNAPEIVELTCFETTYPHISKALDYQGRIFYIKRIMKVDGNPIALNRIWIPEHFAPELDQVGLCVENSLSKTLKEKYGLRPSRRENIIETLRPSVSEVELLKITFDTLIMQISSTSYKEGNIPYEHSITSWIGDAIRLKIDVTDIEYGLQFTPK